MLEEEGEEAVAVAWYKENELNLYIFTPTTNRLHQCTTNVSNVFSFALLFISIIIYGKMTEHIILPIYSIEKKNQEWNKS